MNTSPIDQAMMKRLLTQKGVWTNYNWTVQGFGMVRCYLDAEQRFRLNIWDERLRTPGVSLIHDHPWSFTSKVFCGRIRNKRYHFATTSQTDLNYNYKHIITGPDGADASPVMQCRLMPYATIEEYKAGQTYSQKLTEVHETDALRGTVTVNDRTAPTNEYTARVFWHKQAPEWIAARPRPATVVEIIRAIDSATELMP